MFCQTRIIRIFLVIHGLRPYQSFLHSAAVALRLVEIAIFIKQLEVQGRCPPASYSLCSRVARLTYSNWFNMYVRVWHITQICTFK